MDIALGWARSPLIVERPSDSCRCDRAISRGGHTGRAFDKFVSRRVITRSSTSKTARWGTAMPGPLHNRQHALASMATRRPDVPDPGGARRALAVVLAIESSFAFFEEPETRWRRSCHSRLVDRHCRRRDAADGSFCRAPAADVIFAATGALSVWLPAYSTSCPAGSASG
jgi:hypothetical protein